MHNIDDRTIPECKISYIYLQCYKIRMAILILWGIIKHCLQVIYRLLKVNFSYYPILL